MSAPWTPPATAEALALEWEQDAPLKSDAVADVLRGCARRVRDAGSDPVELLFLADALEGTSRNVAAGARRYGLTPQAEAGAVTSLWCALRLRATAEAITAAQQPEGGNR